MTHGRKGRRTILRRDRMTIMMQYPIIGYAIPDDPTPAAAALARDRSRCRLERHNPSVDEHLADQGACGQIHLPTGRVCLLTHHHDGSCAFDAAPAET